MLRTITAYIIYPVLLLTGFRFSKHYRWGTTLKHRIIYKMVNTIRANVLAGIEI